VNQSFVLIAIETLLFLFNKLEATQILAALFLTYLIGQQKIIYVGGCISFTSSLSFSNFISNSSFFFFAYAPKDKIVDVFPQPILELNNINYGSISFLSNCSFFLKVSRSLI
jgi:hypothetical protein